MCLEVVDRAVKDEEILTQLAIPPLYWDVIAESWRARDPSLYGRMDFAWCGNAPVKLLEYNADTPTSLYESAYFQWLWLEDARRGGIIPRDADQYNAIQERLISRFSELYSREPFYFLLLSGYRRRQEYRAVLAGLRRAGRAGVSVYLH